MNSDFSYIDENLKKIRYNIGEAVAKYRKPDEEIKLMAVTKTVSPEAVNYAISKGINLLGENRVQEYQSKKDFYDQSADVHIIGHLQTNKVKYIINSVKMIQSVDSLKLAREIDRLARENGRVMDILCEVNIGREESKSGIMPEAAFEFAEALGEMKNIRVCGLMAIPPAENSEKFLSAMHDLYIDISEKKSDNISMDILSLGMSGDYINAIKYGSTLVRIGSGLFGARVYK